MCLNYRSPTFEQDLIRETKGFVDVYFGQSCMNCPETEGTPTSVLTKGQDNVGGHILDLMLKRLKAHGRVAAWYVVTYTSQ